uniref:Outer membrane channel n=1 Tax=Geobacter metallireducens TaxID=28232 RepID=A0A831XMK5_GEOME
MGITKKTLMITASAALTVATAVPALALENEFHGMFRLFGAVSNFNATDNVEGFYVPQGNPKDAPTATYIAQRARLMYIAKANDDLKLVTHFEIDSRWGDAAYTTKRNLGGAIGADTVNIETKSVYLDFNCPITGANVKVGMQPNDDAFKGVLFGADMAGLLASRSFGSLDAAAGFFRFNDSGLPGKQARDMVAATAKYAVTKDIKVGGAYYFIDDDRSAANDYVNQEQGNTNTIHNVGVNAEANLGPVTVDGFFLYQFGSLRAPASRHVSAFAGNVGARGKIGPGTARTEFLYVSGDKGGSNTTNAFQSVDDEHGFYNGNMQLLFRDAYAMTIDNAVVYTSNNQDQGVIAGFLGYDLPVTSKLSTSFNAGFAAVAKENGNKPVNPVTGQANKSNYIGTELNASVDYKLFDNMTASVRGAYVILGDYFDGVAAGGQDPRDPYMGSVILNYAF